MKEKQQASTSKKIRKGDKVIAIAGNSRGMTGTVLSRSGDKVVVQGLNIRKRHMKGQGDSKGQILQIEKPINISNLKVCTEDGKPVKLHVRIDDQGERQLYYKDGSQEVLFRTVKTNKT
jgi:large subunit ribosomal protein L24